MGVGIAGKARSSAWATIDLSSARINPLAMSIPGEVDSNHAIEDLYTRLYTAVCRLLSSRRNQVAWAAFSERDWITLGKLAEEQGVAPLLHWHFKQNGLPESAPLALRDLVKSAYYQSAAQNALLQRELGLLLNALEEAGIPVIALKGAHLAIALYPEIALRPMNDLDLLVHEADFDRARQALASIGYTLPFPVLSQQATRQVGFELYLSKPGENIPGVELHWGLVASQQDRRAASVSWFWDNSELFSSLNRQPDGHSLVRALTPTSNLLYLCGHLFLEHGASERLLWLYDIYLLLTHCAQHIDWELLINKADEFGWMQPLANGLWAAQHDLAAPLPEGLLEEVRSRHPGLTLPERGVYLPLPHHAQATWNALSNLRWGARLRMGLAVLFPSPAHLRWRYQPNPPWLLPLYYPVKWAGMIRDGARLLWDCIWG